MVNEYYALIEWNKDVSYLVYESRGVLKGLRPLNNPKIEDDKKFYHVKKFKNLKELKDFHAKRMSERESKLKEKL